jgi:hypothetical protein
VEVALPRGSASGLALSRGFVPLKRLVVPVLKLAVVLVLPVAEFTFAEVGIRKFGILGVGLCKLLKAL